MARLPVVPVRGDPALLNRLFEPLGYEVDATAFRSMRVPRLGASRYLAAHDGHGRLRDLLEHLFVLLPVLDDVSITGWVPTRWTDSSRRGEWLSATRSGSDRPAVPATRPRPDRRGLGPPDGDPGGAARGGSRTRPKRPSRARSLNAQRLETVVTVLRSGARRVLDLGCGAGSSLDAPAGPKSNVFSGRRLVPVARDGAAAIHLDEMAPGNGAGEAHPRLAHVSRPRLEGFDAAAVGRGDRAYRSALASGFERVLFGYAHPGSVIVTTPERRYNVRFDGFPSASCATATTDSSGRGRVRRLGAAVADLNGYASSCRGSARGRRVGQPTQMAVFTAMTVTSPSCRWSCWSARAGRASRLSPLGTSLPTEVLSSDFCRGLVCDDENDQAATNDAFEVLHFIAGKRLAAGQLTVVDATNVQAEVASAAGELAKRHHVLAVAIVLDVPRSVCAARNAARPDRTFGAHVVRRQHDQLRRSIRASTRRASTAFMVLTASTRSRPHIEREPLWNDRRHEHGPFDIIGDVHGCYDELGDTVRRARLRDRRGRGRGDASRRPPGGLPRRPRRSWPERRRQCCASPWGWCATAPRCVSRATTRTSCSARCGEAR